MDAGDFLYADVNKDIEERCYRFLEEVIELVQSIHGGLSEEDCIRTVKYVYGRNPGVPQQEVGGVMVTLTAMLLSS